MNRYRNTKSYNVIKDSLILSSNKNEIPKVFDNLNKIYNKGTVTKLEDGDEVYTIKGYDESFRLLTYTKNEYGEFIKLKLLIIKC
jgi:hypothetical protein